MKHLLTLAAWSALALPAFAAETPPAPETPKTGATEVHVGHVDGAKRPGTATADKTADARRRDREATEKAFYKQLIAETPELRGVDPETPEGKRKIRQVMTAKHKNGEMPEVGPMMKVMRARTHAKLMRLLAMAPAEFAAIEPFLARVEQLRSQKFFVDIPTTIKGLGLAEAMNTGDEDAEKQIGGLIKGFLGADVDPVIKEYQTSTGALKTVLADPQANSPEKSAAVARVRKAREAYQTAVDKAQLELRSVLTTDQEALLVDHGILD